MLRPRCKGGRLNKHPQCSAEGPGYNDGRPLETLVTMMTSLSFLLSETLVLYKPFPFRLMVSAYPIMPLIVPFMAVKFHTVRKRFIVWHTVRIDSSCAHVSTRGPHSKLCATRCGPPCKQGATFTTLHVSSFDFENVFSFVAQDVHDVRNVLIHFFEGTFWKTMVLKFEQLVQPICEFAHLPLEGTNAKMTSHIGCISPRRQARGRRTLQISKLTNRTFQDSGKHSFQSSNFVSFARCGGARGSLGVGRRVTRARAPQLRRQPGSTGGCGSPP